MSDNDIIKALECCKGEDIPCTDCPYIDFGQCQTYVASDALKLISRQSAEIERLNHIRAELSKEIEKLRDMVAQNEGVLPRYEQLLKAEAIKEFADKLKKELTTGSGVMRRSVLNIIDDTLKEMTEEQK